MDNRLIHGQLDGYGTVDDSSCVANSLTGRVVKDSTLTGADFAARSFGETSLDYFTIGHSRLALNGIEYDNIHAAGPLAGDVLTMLTDSTMIWQPPTVPDTTALQMITLGLGPSTPGFFEQYDGAGKKVTVLPSASMAGDASFYWPVATGSTNGIYQKTATGAQITLSPTGLTALGASGTVSGGLGSFTRLDVTGVSGADTSVVKNQLHVGKKFIVGGWGNIGKTYFQRDGLEWSFGPTTLAGSGATEYVHGSANSGDVMTYSVSGSTETLTPSSPETVMNSMPIWQGIVTLPASTQYVGYRAPGATANTVVNANWEDSVTGTNITYITVSASTDTLWATASSTKLVDRVLHISGQGN
jgi:hypothetical protein